MRGPQEFLKITLDRHGGAMKTHQMCSTRRYGSTDMQHDLFRSDQDLDLRSNFLNDLSGQGQIIVHSTRLDERNTMLMLAK